MIEAEADGIMSGGEHIEPTGWAGVDSVVGGRQGTGTQRGRGYGGSKRIWMRTESTWWSCSSVRWKLRQASNKRKATGEQAIQQQTDGQRIR